MWLSDIKEWNEEEQGASFGYLAELIGASQKLIKRWLLFVQMKAKELSFEKLNLRWLAHFEPAALETALQLPETVPVSPDFGHFQEMIDKCTKTLDLPILVSQMFTSLESRVGEISDSQELVYLYLSYQFFVGFCSNLDSLANLVNLLSKLKSLTERKQNSAGSRVLKAAYEVK